MSRVPWRCIWRRIRTRTRTASGEQVIASGTLDWAWGTDPDRSAHPGRPLLRLVDAAALATDVPGLDVWPGNAVISVGRGVQRVSVPFELQREGGLGGAVDLTVSGLPAGVAVVDPGAVLGLTGLRGSVRPGRGRRHAGGRSPATADRDIGCASTQTRA